MYLLDTDFIISLHFPAESNHQNAVNIAQQKLINQDAFYLDLVLQELATVISHKYSQKDATFITKKLLNNSKSIISLENSELQQTWDLFFTQLTKGTSFVDCANITASKNYNLELLSFDKFYKKQNFKK